MSTDRADATAAWLDARGAGQLPHTGRTLAIHLHNVWEMLRRWGQPERVCLAGLAHSVYSTDAFPEAVVGFETRPELRDLLGEEAEELVFLYCTLPRPALLDSLEGTDPGGAVATVDRRDGSPRLLPRRALGDLAVINTANLAEQGQHDELAAGHWVASASRWARLAGRCAQHVPPVFAGGTVAVRPDEEQRLLDRYRAAFAAPAGEARTLLEGLPAVVGEPLVVGALASLADGADPAAVAAAGARGLELLQAWGTPWDKRLPLEAWTKLAERVAHGAGDPSTWATPPRTPAALVSAAAPA